VTDLPTNLAFFLPGHMEWIVLLVLGLLIFGRRLPEVGRSLGRGIVEFKRGIKGIEEEIEDESSRKLPKPAPPEKLVSRRSPASSAEPEARDDEEASASAPQPRARRGRGAEPVAARDEPAEDDAAEG
jgi:sec-independent protein translocase protein TatA